VIYRWRHPTRASHLLGIAQGFAELADGLITLCTLGFFALPKDLQNWQTD